MSVLANLDHLAATEGVVALMLDAPGESRVFRGSAKWQTILHNAIHLFSLTGEPSIRLVIAHHTLVLQKEQEQIIAVVFPTGHIIAKSLRRMIRRVAKQRRIAPRTPRRPRVPREQTVSTVQAASSVGLPGISHSRPENPIPFHSEIRHR